MHRFPPSKATANARHRFAEMSAVTGPQVSSVSLVLSLIGTITGNRALAVPARAQRAHSFMIIFEASKNLARFRRVSGPVLVVAYDLTVPRYLPRRSAGNGPSKGEISKSSVLPP